MNKRYQELVAKQRELPAKENIKRLEEISEKYGFGPYFEELDDETLNLAITNAFAEWIDRFGTEGTVLRLAGLLSTTLNAKPDEQKGLIEAFNMEVAKFSLYPKEGEEAKH